MKIKGLCSTCVEVTSCTFKKEPVVLQCEEFSSGESSPVRPAQAKTKKTVSCETATESE